MKIVDNKALLLRVRDAERIINAIPKSRVLSEHVDHYEVLVHWGLEEARALKNLGLQNIPSPILEQYQGGLPSFCPSKDYRFFFKHAPQSLLL